REGQLLAGTGNVDGAIVCFQRLVSSQLSVVSGPSPIVSREGEAPAEPQEKSQDANTDDSFIRNPGSAGASPSRIGQQFGSVEVGYTGYLANHELALLYHRKGMSAEAEAEWRRVVEEQPEHLPAWLGLGELYLAQGKWEPLEDIIQCMVGEKTENHGIHGIHGKKSSSAVSVSSVSSVVKNSSSGPLTTHDSPLTPYQEEGQVLRARGMLARKEF